MCYESPKDWVKWLPLAEYWYNTTYHTAAKLNPFEVVYGQPPPIHKHYLPGTCLVEAVDRSLQQREKTLQVLKENLARARNKMVQLANRKRSERSFMVGEWVYLKLRPYRQQSTEARPNQKMAPRYFGPYQVTRKVGSVAYTLEPPEGSKIHPTFHVSMLKKHHGPLPSQPTIPLPSSWEEENVIPRVSIAVLDKISIKRRNTAVVQWLMQWNNAPMEDATWEDAKVMMQQFPNFDPWGRGSSHGGSIDTIVDASMEAQVAKNTELADESNGMKGTTNQKSQA